MTARLLRPSRWLALGAAMLAATGCALPVQPTSSILRSLGDRASRHEADDLARFAPDDGAVAADLAYDPTDPSLRLDLYTPASTREPRAPLPTIVWVHGGAWVSGDKAFIAPYARILAQRGFAVAVVDYTLAPEARYPVPVRQVNTALAWLAREGPAHGADPTRVILAGDSAGAHIAAQVAVIATSPEYSRAMGIDSAIDARHLIGALFYCGTFGIQGGPPAPALYRAYVSVVVRAYFDTTDFDRDDPRAVGVDVADRVTARFPPTFIAAANDDPLEYQSRGFDARLRAAGVATRTLFFDVGALPAVHHEFQFHLDTAAGREARDATFEFLDALLTGELSRSRD